MSTEAEVASTNLSPEMKSMKVDKPPKAAKSSGAAGENSEAAEEKKFTVKCPKGTRDYGPKQMAVREPVLRVITDTFKRHGAMQIDTPVFELSEVLLGKYGDEGGKLVYDLNDQGGEKLSMRYDLTVPFARYLAMNRITNMKRWQIAKVYRRDQPKMTRGRYREFMQCDFDIAGAYDVMLPESECLRILYEILKDLQLGDFVIKVNHRNLLDGLFASCGIKKNKFKAVCATIDKLDKVSWEDVRNEIINEKGVAADLVDKMQPILTIREANSELSNAETITSLQDSFINKDKLARKALEQMATLLEYCTLLGIEDKIRIDPSLARGLDYYTGVIFEAVYLDYAKSSEADTGPSADTEQVEETNAAEEATSVGVGSVAGGGRYDELVSMFMGKGPVVPCVGLSIGIERLFAIMQMKHEKEQLSIKSRATQVYVASAHKKLCAARLELATLLWEGGIPTEMPYKTNPLLLGQLQHCEQFDIPMVVILGDDELKRGVVKLRQVVSREEEDIPRDKLVETIKLRMADMQ